MVKVKLFGLLRLDCGLRELELEAGSVHEVYPLLLEAVAEKDPRTSVTRAELDGCIVMLNGKEAKKNAVLHDGDELMLVTPVCGG